MHRFHSWLAGRRAWRLRARPPGTEPDLTVSGRLPLYGLLVFMLLATGGCFLFVRAQQTADNAQETQDKAAFIASSILRPHLSPQDLVLPVGAARRAQLDRLFAHQILLDGNRRAALVSRAGVITYSTDHTLIGRPAWRAATGHPGVLEVQVPLELSPSVPRGSFELSVARAPLLAAAEDQALRSTGFLALVLLAIYILFLPVLHVATH